MLERMHINMHAYSTLAYSIVVQPLKRGNDDLRDMGSSPAAFQQGNCFGY